MFEPHFSPGIDIDCAKTIFEIVRSGSLVSRNDEAIDCAANFIGRANAMRLGVDTDDTPSPVFGVGENPSLEDCCDRLEAALPASEEAAGISPLQILQMIQLISEIIRLLTK